MPMARSLTTIALVVSLFAGAVIVRADETDRIGDAWHDQRNPIVQIFKGERLGLWSLKWGGRPCLPDLQHSAVSSPLNSIDNFILAKLTAAGQQFSPQADRRT